MTYGKLSETGLEGEIVTFHENEHVGSYGLIRADSGKVYIWSAGHVFRNFSFAVLGQRYRFDVAHFSYATNIDQINKRPVKS